MITARDLQGHWQRKWIKTPDRSDDSTQVHWLQAGDLFADIRIPADRSLPDHATCLSDLGSEDLAGMMRAEGFAGHTTVTNGVCTWHRAVNWHGRPDGLDAGHMSFHANGDLIEDGVHADYQELWQPVSSSTLTGMQVRAGSLTGVLVWSETIFLLGLGEPSAPSTSDLLSALGHGEKPEAISAHPWSGYTMGQWDGDVGVATLSTNPFCEGHPALVPADRDGFTFRYQDFAGAWHGVPLQVDQSRK